MHMARSAAAVDGLGVLLADPELPLPRKLDAVSRSAELAREFECYLTDFGDRCLEELKLESPTVRDDPASLLISIGSMALRGDVEAQPHPEPAAFPRIANPLKRALFRHVLRHARERVCSRENLRFERTRLFGRVRAILRELGKRLHADGVLESADDVFYLELGEILAVWDATGTTAISANWRKLRRAEFAEYESTEAPPDRFLTRGPVTRYGHFENARPPVEEAGSLSGTGACPGRVTGRVRVVLDPRGARLEHGEILVARQTDPGWVVLFPAAAGLLVERGSLLSHSAIVSRELRLPCIVSLPGITRLLKSPNPHPQIPRAPQQACRRLTASTQSPCTVLALRREPFPRRLKRLVHKLLAANHRTIREIPHPAAQHLRHSQILQHRFVVLTL
jgi:rifampicin phosphotransferase